MCGKSEQIGGRIRVDRMKSVLFKMIYRDENQFPNKTMNVEIVCFSEISIFAVYFHIKLYYVEITIMRDQAINDQASYTKKGETRIRWITLQAMD